MTNEGQQSINEPERSPIKEAYVHLERCKRILEEWKEMEKALEEASRQEAKQEQC